MKFELPISIMPGETFDGGKWYYAQTLLDAFSEFYASGKNTLFICKGNGVTGNQLGSICIDISSRIGVVTSYDYEYIEVEIDETIVPKNILKLLKEEKFEANPRFIIKEVDYNNCILSMVLLSFDLKLRESE